MLFTLRVVIYKRFSCRTSIWAAWWKTGKNDASLKHRLKVSAVAHGASMLSPSAITARVPGVSSPCSIVHPWDAARDPWTQVAGAAAVLKSFEGVESALPVPVLTDHFIMNPLTHSKDIQPGAKMKS